MAKQVDNPMDKQVGGTHYQAAVQHVEFCHMNYVPWCESCAIKYITRHRKKNGVEDIKKAIHYLEFLIALDHARREESPDYMDPDAFDPSTEEFVEANEIPEEEATIIALILSHHKEGEMPVHEAIKRLKKIEKNYDDYALLG